MNRTEQTPSDDEAGRFLTAFRSGAVCLHPTDTLPGLTFDPAQEEALQTLVRFKRRASEKPFVSLVPSLEEARTYWDELPSPWEKILAELWPAPLTVVWRASERAPASLVAPEGTLALRVPALAESASWFRAVLEQAQVPLPTTSVNRAAQSSANSWKDACRRLQGRSGFYIPQHNGDPPREGPVGMASTIVGLSDTGAWDLIRPGALSLEAIRNSTEAAGV